MKHFFIIILCSLFFIGAHAQSPQSFKYQTTVRDNSGNLLSNKLVAFRISLLQGSASGSVTYAERHSIATNDFGIANFNVGQGSVLQGVFSSINWGNGPYFLKIDLDLNNGTNYVFMGSSQLLSVPFALYAANSGNAADDKDKDSTNEIQSLSITGSKLNLSKSNSVTIDADTTNELQSLSVSGNRLSLTKANDVTIDADTLNEIQQISLSQHVLRLNKGGNDVDLKPYAKDSQLLVLQGNTLSITNGNSIILSGPVDLDSDPTNEIQSIVQNGNTLTLSRDTTIVQVPKTSNIVNGSLLFAQATGRDTINLTLNTSIADYTIGMIINFKVASSNTKNVMVRVNNLGLKNIFKNINTALSANDLKAGQMASIIYDGQDFQFFVVPYANESKNAQMLKNDTAGALVPVGAFIESESSIPPVGYTSTGRVRSEELEITIINSDSAYNGIKYIDTFNNNHYFFSARPASGGLSFNFSRYDSVINRFIHISTQTVIASEGYYHVKIFNGKIYLITITGIGNSNWRQIKLYSYDLITNNFQDLYNFSFTTPSMTDNNNITNLGFKNNSIIFVMQHNFSNVFLGNTLGRNIYRWNINNGVVTRFFYGDAPLSIIGKNLYMLVRNDSIYDLNLNFDWVFKNKFGVSNKSLTSVPVLIGNIVYYKDYIYNITTNTVSNRNNSVFIIAGYNLNGTVLASNGSFGTTMLFDKLFVSDLSINNVVAIPSNSLNTGFITPSNLSADRMIYYNESYVWSTGGGIVYSIKMPKRYYQYVKN